MDFKYIKDTVNIMERYSEDQESLFNCLNDLSKSHLNKLINDYELEDKIEPVNLLRYLTLKLIEKQKLISISVFDDCKRRIEANDVEYIKGICAIESEYEEKFINEDLKNVFKSWKDPFKVYHPFLWDIEKYANELSALSEKIVQDINNRSSVHFDYSWTDFKGSRNQGDVETWISLGPKTEDRTISTTVQIGISFHKEHILCSVYIGNDLKDYSINEDRRIKSKKVNYTEKAENEIIEFAREYYKLTIEENTKIKISKADAIMYAFWLSKFIKTRDDSLTEESIKLLENRFNEKTIKGVIRKIQDRLGDSRLSEKFYNIIKNYRDQLDAYFDNGRIGWRDRADATQPGKLTSDILSVYQKYQNFDEESFWKVLSGSNEQVLEREKHAVSYDEISSNIFIDDQQINFLIELIKRRKNVIFKGPPGVGKTFLVKNLSKLILNDQYNSNLEFVQFHQSYSYDDFIFGIRPSMNGTFEAKPGIFYDFCIQKANLNRDKIFIFVIDEINRGNLSKIFGELLYLIEPDKRNEKVRLSSSISSEHFTVPSNVIILGTMNTADRSLARIDYALRRRFAFFELKPMLDNQKFKSYLMEKGIGEDFCKKLASTINEVNNIITKRFGPGFEIGHSYFTPSESIKDASKWYQEILEYELIPLLEEYFDVVDEDKTQIINKLKAI